MLYRDDDFKSIPDRTVQFTTSSMTTSNQPPLKPLKSLKDPNEHLMDDEQSLGSQRFVKFRIRIQK